MHSVPVTETDYRNVSVYPHATIRPSPSQYRYFAALMSPVPKLDRDISAPFRSKTALRLLTKERICSRVVTSYMPFHPCFGQKEPLYDKRADRRGAERAADHSRRGRPSRRVDCNRVARLERPAGRVGEDARARSAPH